MPESYLFDTVTCIRWRRGDKGLRQKVELLPPGSIYTSVVTVGELQRGVNEAPVEQRDRMQDRVRELLARFKAIFDVTREGAETYGRIVAQVPRGLLIGDNDFWIAAIALTHDLVLITKDSDFDRVPGLRKEGWPA